MQSTSRRRRLASDWKLPRLVLALPELVLRPVLLHRLLLALLERDGALARRCRARPQCACVARTLILGLVAVVVAVGIGLQDRRERNLSVRDWARRSRWCRRADRRSHRSRRTPPTRLSSGRPWPQGLDPREEESPCVDKEAADGIRTHDLLHGKQTL